MGDVYSADKAIRNIASHTPLLESASLSKLTGASIYLKLECFQPTRVFKVRGATNKIMNSPEDKAIVAASSGNHGFAISFVCKRLGRKAIVCVPKNANPDKIKAIEQYGAKVIAIGTSYEDAQNEALRIQKETGAILAHAYEDPFVMAGQATIGLELLNDMPDIDTVLVPIGGGGLISGIAYAIKQLKKETKVIGVQTVNAPTMAEAFRAGRPVPVTLQPTIADGLIVASASEVTFGVIHEYVDDIVLVSESQIERALLQLLSNDHILSEPSGAATVAAIMYPYKPEPREKVALVVSGGNISIDYLTKLLAKSNSGG
jgi:threonine dehydratase